MDYEYDYDAIVKQQLKNVNDVWNISYPGPPRTTASKITFASEVAVQEFVDDAASKASRLGFWKIDADRFRRRIQQVGEILNHILRPDHRARVLANRSTVFQ